MRRFLILCWSVERGLSNGMRSDICPAMKSRLGSIAANPDMWLRLMLGGPLHEMGVEYIAVLFKGISYRP